MARPDAVSEAPGMQADAAIAELLPRAYRRVLDAVDALERRGGRADAARVREAAIRTYAKSWDTRTLRRLEELASRAELLLRELEQRDGFAA